MAQRRYSKADLAVIRAAELQKARGEKNLAQIEEEALEGYAP